jgi:hypothetical protein
MNPVGKALWFIESHFTSEIALNTGAVREQFGVTPEAVREQGHLANLDHSFRLEPLEDCGPEVRGVFASPAHLDDPEHVGHIWHKWLPESGHELVDAADFERYGAEFDSQTGTGGFEIWLPVKA